MGAESAFLSREEHPEATVLVVHARELQPWGPATDALRGALDELVESGVGRVVLDLSEVEILGSYGLCVLLRAQGKLARAGGTLLHASDKGWMAFPVYRDRDEALAGIRRGEPEPLVLCGARPKVRELLCVC
jgi:hypothetical protein